jgi:hypothetical protein
MKKLIFLTCALLSGLPVFCQIPFPSSCDASDSIVAIFKKDADRLAIRQVFAAGHTYKDSLEPDPVLRMRYLDALLAIYNATAVPCHDTIFGSLAIHTKPDPALNAIVISASPSKSWMQEMYGSANPVSCPPLNKLIIRYNMGFTYYQVGVYDKVALYTDTNLNMVAMSKLLMTINGIQTADPDVIFNETRDIADSLEMGFTWLNYSFGWGTCYNGCDYRKNWRLNVNTSDCSVGYAETNGPVLFTGITSHASQNEIIFFPNPVKDILQIRVKDLATNMVRITDVFGKEMLSGTVNEKRQIDIKELSPGVYFLSFETQGSRTVHKIMKE